MTWLSFAGGSVKSWAEGAASSPSHHVISSGRADGCGGGYLVVVWNGFGMVNSAGGFSTLLRLNACLIGVVYSSVDSWFDGFVKCDGRLLVGEGIVDGLRPLLAARWVAHRRRPHGRSTLNSGVADLKVLAVVWGGVWHWDLDVLLRDGDIGVGFGGERLHALRGALLLGPSGGFLLRPGCGKGLKSNLMKKQRCYH